MDGSGVGSCDGTTVGVIKLSTEGAGEGLAVKSVVAS